MAETFQLRIVTLDGLSYDGRAEKLIVRTITGDVGILPHHINFVTALGMGEAKVYSEGTVRSAACIGGLLSVSENVVTLAPTTFEWAEDIDKARAQAARERAENLLKTRLSEQEQRVAEAKLKRALVRSSVAGGR
ncbi:MAG: ATP synthase F1 subunit epsilon [Oscillospiraceae bacterium]|nr:ATP synthase F1 subunit epsilon [Oscillospiraceae bacterium]